MNSPDNLSQRKNFSPGELFAAFRTKADLALSELQKRINFGLQQQYEIRLNQLKAIFDDSSKKAIENYNKEIKELEKYKDMPILFEPASKSAMDTLNTTLKSNEQLLQQFIENCRDLLSK